MTTLINNRILNWLSLPLVFLLAAVSTVGLLYPEIYTGATPNWKTQTIGQDAVDLVLITPVLLLSTIYAAKGSRIALSAWAGVNIYIVYTFLIYCFDVRFNQLFVVYCFILGLSSYSVGLFMLQLGRDKTITQLASARFRSVLGYFMIILATAFYLLWLSDIVPAIISGEIPRALTTTGLLTNPVHVIDMAIVLPLVFIVGLLVLNGHSLATALAPAIIVFFILMDITIATLAVLLFQAGLESSYAVAVIMGVHGGLSIAAFLFVIRNIIYQKSLSL